MKVSEAILRFTIQQLRAIIWREEERLRNLDSELSRLEALKATRYECGMMLEEYKTMLREIETEQQKDDK